MGWYDIFSHVYDASLERLYVEQRAAATEALALAPGMTVVDLPCGTGQSFDGISQAIGPTGTLVGVDLSAGMLRRAAKRGEPLGNVVTIESDVHTLDASQLEAAMGRAPTIDRLHVFLGMTAFPRFEEALGNLWQLLAPGGRCVIVDVHNERPGFQGSMVNLMARADIRRRWWEPLDTLAADATRTELPSTWQHGGALWLASGSKAAGT